MTTMTRLAAILGVAVLATACGDFKSMSGPSPMASAHLAPVAVQGDAPTFGKKQTSVAILDREVVDGCPSTPSQYAPVVENGNPTTWVCSQVNTWVNRCTTDPLHYICDDVTYYPDIEITHIY